MEITPKGLLLSTAVVLVLAIIAWFVAGSSPNATQNSIEDFQSTNTGVTIPEPTDYFVDKANLLTTEQQQGINILLSQTKNIQIGVLTVPNLQGLTIEQYGIRVAEKWKVGYKGVDNGVLIIIAVQERKVRIEVGHGLTGSLTDAQANDILVNDMVPWLKKNEWESAIIAGIKSIQKYGN